MACNLDWSPMEEQKILEHFLAPKHEIVPKDLESALLVKIGAKKEQLARIGKEDPAVEEIGAQPGEIIKITRNSHTAGKAVYFRVVEP